MSKVLAVEHPNSCVDVILGAEKNYRNEIDIHGRPKRGQDHFDSDILEYYRLKGCRFYWVDEEKSRSSELESYKQRYIEDGQLKYDFNWERQIMGVGQIRSRHMNRLNRKIDEELSKESPDILCIERLRRELERCSQWSDKQWYGQALKNMDEDQILKKEVRSKINKRLSAMEQLGFDSDKQLIKKEEEFFLNLNKK